MVEINQRLLPMKMHYFYFNAGVAPLFAFGSVFARQTGISALTVGCMFTILTVLSVFVKITLCGIADKYKKRRPIFILTVLFCICSSFLLCFIKINNFSTPVNILCHGETFIESCHEGINNDVISKIKKRDYNGSVRCELTCENSLNLIEEICHLWISNESCTFENETSIVFNAFIIKKHIFPLNQCLYSTISQAMLPSHPDSITPVCRKDLKIPCTIMCDNYELSDEFRDKQLTFLQDIKQLTFWIVFILYALYICGTSLNFSLSDAICFNLLGNRPDLYGSQRLFGALGFGLMTLVCGWLVDMFSQNSVLKNYSPMYVGACIVFFFDLYYVICALKINQQVNSSSVGKDITIIFYNGRVIMFSLWCLLTGMFCGVCWQFLFWHLEDVSTADDLKWSRTLQGLAILFNTILGEIPVFFISGWVIKRLGHVHTMTLLLFSSAVRFFCYSILTRPVWVLPIELLSGFVFSMSYVILASYSNKIALPGTESTVQAIFGAIFEGAGMALGNLFGGIIYHLHNGYVLFSLMSYLSLVGAILHALIQYKLNSAFSRILNNAKHSTAVYMSPTEAISVLNE